MMPTVAPPHLRCIVSSRSSHGERAGLFALSVPPRHHDFAIPERCVRRQSFGKLLGCNDLLRRVQTAQRVIIKSPLSRVNEGILR
jgi:hypothetical protein